MQQTNREELIRLITAQVMDTLRQAPASAPPPADLPAALLIGEQDRLPPGTAEQYRLQSDCSCAGGEWDTILITRLSTAQLADIALGRDEGEVPQAVIRGLLHGATIRLFASALPHRACADRCSPEFYKLLEGYVNALQRFGVQLEAAGSPQQAPKGVHPHPAPPGGLVTEELAHRLVAQCGSEILLQKGTLLTPSARDVFLHSRCRVRYTGPEK